MSRVVAEQHETGQGTYLSYTCGFVVSIVLTIGAYLLVVNHILHGWNLVFGLVGLGIVQLFMQMIFFLHLGSGPNRRLNLAVFGFMLLVVLIVVGGSLWIMYNLNYHMISPSDINQYLKSQDAL